MNTTEALILQSVMTEEVFARKVLPFIESKYFERKSERALFDVVKEFLSTYGSLPSSEAIVMKLSETKGISEEEYKQALESMENCRGISNDQNTEWLLDTTEKWCQERALYLGIMDSIAILDGKDKKHEKNAIPEILKEALGVSFDNYVGFDVIENSDAWFDECHRKVDRHPFHLEQFNLITKGGLPKKTLNVILAGTGVGKSLFMCDHAANSLLNGKRVLYITCEMAEERIAERVYANILDIPLDDLQALPKDIYAQRLDRVSRNLSGKMIVKEYPTASAHVGHFRHLLNELNLKKNFVPDIIFVDYLNICCSSRMKLGNSVNSYNLVKAIAEELRGLAVEFNVPIVTATQTNREGFDDSDVGMKSTSDSFGIPMSADFFFALITSEELEKLNQFMVKQLKNRYSDASKNRKFVIGVDRSKMKLYNVEQSAQDGVSDEDREAGKDLSPYDAAAWAARKAEEGFNHASGRKSKFRMKIE